MKWQSALAFLLGFPLLGLAQNPPRIFDLAEDGTEFSFQIYAGPSTNTVTVQSSSKASSGFGDLATFEIADTNGPPFKIPMTNQMAFFRVKSGDLFSTNVVGYVKISVRAGYNAIGSPLLRGDNKVGTIFPSVPEGTAVYKYTGQGYEINAYDMGEWLNPNQTLVPGEGAFLRFLADQTLTFIGEVAFNPSVSTFSPGVFYFITIPDPSVGKISDWIRTSNVAVYIFKADSSGFNIFVSDPGFGWDPSEPVYKPAMAFFVQFQTVWSPIILP